MQPRVTAHLAGSDRRGRRARHQRLLGLAAILAASVLAASACGGDDLASDARDAKEGADRPTVLVTTSIWAEIVSHVACGGLADVETIITVGGDPHGFEPSLQDRARMERAHLVVANGLGLEEGLEDTLAAVAESGTPVFEFAEEMEAIPHAFEFGHHDEDDDGEEGHGRGGDPHVWFDPQRVSGALGALAVRLTADAGLDANAVAECLAVYQAELAGVDAEIAEMVSRLAPDQRKLVTNHDALGYFADRYGFEIVGTVIPVAGPMGQTSPAQLEALAEVIEHEGVRAIFAEALNSVDDVAALADRVGDVDVVTLYSGSLGPAGSGAETYTGFMQTNAELIVESLH